MAAGVIILLVLTIGSILVAVVIFLPRRQVRKLEESQKYRFDAENEARRTVVQAVGGALLLGGVYFTYRNLAVAERTLSLNREGQYADRLAKAIDLLSSDRMDSRVGAVYVLEALANESETHHGPVIEILRNFIHERVPAGKTPNSVEEKGVSKMLDSPPDVIAAITVIARRNRSDLEKHLDFISVRLALGGLDLSGAHFGKTFVSGTQIVNVFLKDANLEEATFMGSDLFSLNLTQAHARKSRWLGCTISSLWANGVRPAWSGVPGIGLRLVRISASELGGRHRLLLF
jgi:hypothetical protein